MPPINKPIITAGSLKLKVMSASKLFVKSAKRTSAAKPAEPIAYPLVTAFVVLPTASRGSVMPRISSGNSAISAMPPALSVIGPKASSATIIPVSESMEVAAIAIPYKPAN